MVRESAGRCALALLLGTAFLCPAAVLAQEPARPSLNLYGQPGLIDLPSAEALPDGEVAGSWAWFEGTQRRNLSFQILPRVTTTLRWATLADFGDPPDDLTDRSFDLTFQLMREDAQGWRPSLALGFRDIFGTGVYSSEFLAVSKRVHPDVTVTAGIGWGRLGTLGGFSNPFCEILGGDFCDRPDAIGSGGGLATNRFFRGGSAAPFAGIEWRTPLDGLSLKAEYSPDAYEAEQAGPGGDFERKSRFNLGAEYRITRGITIGGYWMHGSTLGVNLSVTANPNRPLVPQNLAPGPLPVTARAEDAPMGRGWAGNESARDQLATALAAALDAEGIRLEELRVTPERAEIRVTNRRHARDPQAIGRAVRVLQVGMPASVETFRVTLIRDGLPVSTTEIDRATFEALIDQPEAGPRLWQASRVKDAGLAPEAGEGVWRRPGRFPDFSFSLAPTPWLVYTGPDDPSRIGLTADALASLRLSPGFSLNARVSQPLLGPSDPPASPGSALQPVRSDALRYFAGRNPDLTRLTADWLGKAAPDIYLRLSGGYLERMFAGISGEILWKPAEQPFGIGLELNHVAQRDIDGGFGFSDYDYDVTTGHASLYWDTGWRGVEIQLDAGRYLAGDWGATLRASRRFDNGWALGAFATLTDVSQSDFGPGGFDRGITLEIPLKWAVPFETRSRYAFEFRGAQRDGGARLAVANRLYPLVRDLDRARIERSWGSVWQ